MDSKVWIYYRRLAIGHSFSTYFIDDSRSKSITYMIRSKDYISLIEQVVPFYFWAASDGEALLLCMFSLELRPLLVLGEVRRASWKGRGDGYPLSFTLGEYPIDD